MAVSWAAPTEKDVEVRAFAVASADREAWASTEEERVDEAGQYPAVKPANGDGMKTNDGDGIAEAAGKASAAAAATVAGEESSSSSKSTRMNPVRAKGVVGKAGHPAKLTARAFYRIVPVCLVSEHQPPALTPSGEAEDLGFELFEQYKSPLTRLRAALTVATEAIAQGLSIRRARLSLTWWPLQPESCELWPLRVTVKN